MFEQSFVGNGKTRRPWTVLVAFAGQVAVIGVLLAIPLFFIQSLPTAQLVDSILLAPAPPPPPPPPPPPAQVHVAKVIHTTPRQLNMSQLIAPKTVPKQIAAINDIRDLPPPSEVAGVIGGVPGGVPGGVMGGVIGGLPSAAPPPPPPKAEPPVTPTRVRMGGNVQAAKLIREIQPDYPVLARDARIAGTVRLQAIISKDGKVEDLKLLSGQPLLVQSAMDAVKKWLYKPTYLNGTPVEVLTEVDVNFHLSS